MPTANINQTKLYYEVHGNGEPLILIAGFSANHTVWTNVLHQLSQYFRVILFDNRGSGQSEHSDHPYNMALLAEDTFALMDYLQIKKAHILGHSMGGMIAQTMAQQCPSRINKLIILASSSHFPAHKAYLFETQLKLREQKLSEELLTQLTLPLVFGRHFFEMPNQVAEMVKIASQYPYPMSVAGYRAQLSALKNFNSQSYLADIKTPCLVFAGREDILTPHDEGQYLAEQLPNASLISFEHSAHAAHIEEADKFLRETLSFLQR